jgi:hypothetical protein
MRVIRLGVGGAPHVRSPTWRRIWHVWISPMTHVKQQDTTEVELKHVPWGFWQFPTLYLPQISTKGYFLFCPCAFCYLGWLAGC